MMGDAIRRLADYRWFGAAAVMFGLAVIERRPVLAVASLWATAFGFLLAASERAQREGMTN